MTPSSFHLYLKLGPLACATLKSSGSGHSVLKRDSRARHWSLPPTPVPPYQFTLPPCQLVTTAPSGPTGQHCPDNPVLFYNKINKRKKTKDTHPFEPCITLHKSLITRTSLGRGQGQGQAQGHSRVIHNPKGISRS